MKNVTYPFGSLAEMTPRRSGSHGFPDHTDTEDCLSIRSVSNAMQIRFAVCVQLLLTLQLDAML